MPVTRRLLFIPVGAILLLVAAVGTAWLVIDPDAYKDRIAEAVTRQTGRKLVLGGHLRLTFTPEPALSVTEVSFANVQGGSRPEMATAQRVEATLAWLPLLQRHFVVTRLTLIGPDLVLERGPDGRPNWIMTRDAPNREPSGAAPAAQSQPAAAPTRGPEAVVVQALRLVDGRVTWHGDHTARFDVAHLDLSEISPDTPIDLTATASHAGTQFDVSGRFGSLDGVRGRDGATPWPVKLSVQAAGATATIDGSFSDPQHTGGYDLAVSASAPDLSLVSPLVPGVTLPALRDLRLQAHVKAAEPLPVFSALVLHAGASDLGATVPGLTLTALDIDAPGADRPVHATASGNFAGKPLRLDVTGGAPDSFLPGPDAGKPFPIDVTAAAAGASLKVKGTIAHPQAQTGVRAAVSADVPDLAALSPLLHRRLPALHGIVFGADIADQGGFAHGLVLDHLTLRAPEAEVTGNLALTLGDHPDLTGRLDGKRLDLDAIRKLLPPDAAASASPAPSSGPSAPAAARSNLLIPDTKLDFSALQRADADLRLALGALTLGGETYRSVVGHAVLHDGHLTLDPATATLPAGAASGHVDIDAHASPPHVAVLLHSAGLATGPLLGELGMPDQVSGTLQIDADLRGVGDSLHALAATADGTLGMSMVGGVVDGRLLTSTFGALLRSVRLPGDSVGDPHANVRCFALRLDVDHGIAAIRTMLIDVSRLRVAGAGTLDFGRETLALRLRPFVKIAGSGLVVPIHVGGTFRKPQAAVDPSGTPEAAAALAVDLANKGAAVSSLTSALAAQGEKLLGDADTGDCGPSLAVARNGAPGPLPAAEKAQKNAPVDNLLKRLFR